MHAIIQYTVGSLQVQLISSLPSKQSWIPSQWLEERIHRPLLHRNVPLEQVTVWDRKAVHHDHSATAGKCLSCDMFLFFFYICAYVCICLCSDHQHDMWKLWSSPPSSALLPWDLTIVLNCVHASGVVRVCGYVPLCMGHVLLSTSSTYQYYALPPPTRAGKRNYRGILIKEAAPIVGHLISY